MYIKEAIKTEDPISIGKAEIYMTSEKEGLKGTRVITKINKKDYVDSKVLTHFEIQKKNKI